jgi:hypothetical protein
MHPVYHAKVLPAGQRCNALEREMILFLQQRLLQPGKPLGKKFARDLRNMLCQMARGRAEDGDEEMRAIYERHSGGNLAQEQREETELFKAMMEGMAGRKLDIEADSPEEWLMKAARQEGERMQAEAERKAQKRQARSSKAAARKEQPGQPGQPQEDPQSAMRSLYRQLASALHPDRETDPEEKVRKTALMGQANAAWEKKDMSALLRLQLQVAGMGPEAVQRLGQEKAKALSQLLRDDVKRLESDLARMQIEVQMTFGLDRMEDASPARLPKLVHARALEVEHEADLMQRELDAIRADDKALRAWLRDQLDGMEEDDDALGAALFGF